MEGMSAPALCQPERRRGRPRVSDEPLTAVTAFIPVAAYERIVKLANQRDDKSVSGLIRDVLIFRIR